MEGRQGNLEKTKMASLVSKVIVSAAVLLAGGLQAAAYSPEYYSQTSLLSSGRWVRISVEETGIHQISYETLRQLGFGDPSKVSVFGYGGARLTSNALSDDLPDDVVPTLSTHTADGRVLFYGEAGLGLGAGSVSEIIVRRNLYDFNGYYFLTDTYDGNIGETSASDISVGNGSKTVISNHLSVGYVENEACNICNGGAVFHDTSLSAGEIREYNFEIRDFNPSGNVAYGRFSYEFAAKSTLSTSMNVAWPEGLTVSSIVNGSAKLVTQTSKFYSTAMGSARVTKVAADGKYSFGLGIADGLDPEYAAIDRVYLIYPRRNAMPDDGCELHMSLPTAAQGDVVEVAEATATTMLWDISDAAAVKSLETIYDESAATVRGVLSDYASDLRRVVAFDAAGKYPEAKIVGDVANQDLHGSPVPEMVIITTDELYESACRLKEIHRQTDGLEVAVVTQQTIFNEFSSGCRSAMAYRRYLKMLYDKDPGKIRYVLLYGHGSWDNRKISPTEQLICYETEDPDQARDYTTNYTADSYFVMLEDDFDATKIPFGRMSLAIGRIEVDDAASAAVINDKIARHLSRLRTPDIYDNVLVFSDDGDNQGHFKQAEQAIADMQDIDKSFTFHRVHDLIYPWEGRVSEEGRKAMAAALAEGQGLMLYAGHSQSPSSLTEERLYDISLIESARCRAFPFACLATCETFCFDRDMSFGKSMLLSSDGGAIGIIGAARTVFMEYNQSMLYAFAEAYARADNATTIGDAYRDAHNYCVTNYVETPRAVNTMCYNLCGDPSLLLGAAGRKMVIDEIDGRSPSPSDMIAIRPMRAVRISGHVADADAVDSRFSGEALLRLYDGPVTVYTAEKRGSDKNHYPVTLDERLLVSKSVNVTDGHFDAEVYVPYPQVPGGPNRLVVSAVSEDGSVLAAGSVSTLAVTTGDDDMPSDPDDPEIIDMYIDDPSFAEGDAVGASFTIHATIKCPGSGIKLSTSAIGEAPRLKLDGLTSFPDAAAATTLKSDGTALFSLPVTDIAEGRHELELALASNAGGRTSRTISFVVVPQKVNARLSIDCTPARESVEIDLVHDFSATPVGRLIIEDALGRTAYSAEDCAFPFVWDLKDQNGNDVPDGLYRAYAVLHDDISLASTAKVDIVVVR